MTKTLSPLISVIMPTYNRLNLIPRSIDSVFGQTHNNIELVIVNDGGESVSEIIKHFPDAEGRTIKYIELPEHKGVSAARNVALENATGKYFSLLDDDDIYLPLALEIRLTALRKYKVEVVYTRALKDIWDVKDNKYYSVKKELYWDCPFDKDLLLLQNVAHSPCVLFSRKAWDKSGNYKFDTNLDTGEDYDFWIGLSRNNVFQDLRIIDAESSIRLDHSQSTGSKDFSISYPIIYKKWRDTAINKEEVIRRQNAMLKQMGKNPSDYGL